MIARLALLSIHDLTLQVQVNLKSRANCAFLPAGMASSLTIGEVSRRSGVASSALRFYEERGLITSERAGSGHRRYPRGAAADRVHRLRPAGRPHARRDRRRAREAPGRPRAQPPRLVASCRAAGRRASTSASPSSSGSSAGLTECIGCGCLSLERCRLANPGDRAAAMGPGPAYWVGDRQLKAGHAAAGELLAGRRPGAAQGASEPAPARLRGGGQRGERLGLPVVGGGPSLCQHESYDFVVDGGVVHEGLYLVSPRPYGRQPREESVAGAGCSSSVSSPRIVW